MIAQYRGWIGLSRCLIGMVTAAVLVAALGSSATAVAPSRAVFAADRADADVSANWAGYVATGLGSTASTATPAMSYSDVTGSWVEPRALCTDTPTSVALWVGLGGYSVNSQDLEQTGTSSDCSANGSPSYYAWYELVPAGLVDVRLKVDPGDLVTSSVVVNGTDVLVQVIDRTRGTRFTRQLTMTSPDTTSAEWIAEAPSECTTPNDCEQIALTKFGQVTFERTYAIGNGVSGTITSPSWTASALSLVPTERRSFAEAGAASSGLDAAGATPVDLAPDGSGFSVSWQADAAAASQPSGATGT